MKPGEVMLQAGMWLDANHPVLRGKKWVDCSDRIIATFVEWRYPTGFEGFVEDLSQANAVS